MCADIHDGQGLNAPSKGRIQMSKTNHLQIVTSGLHRTAGPYICAISDQSAAQQKATYSITSSARASSVGGTSRPSAFAVLRLMTSSYLVGACTGRSAGFSPLRTRAT